MAEVGEGIVLELDDVHTYYGAIHALKGISLKVHEGEVVTLIGRASCRERVCSVV